jgi:hypothetical protein
VVTIVSSVIQRLVIAVTLTRGRSRKVRRCRVFAIGAGWNAIPNVAR